MLFTERSCWFTVHLMYQLCNPPYSYSYILFLNVDATMMDYMVTVPQYNSETDISMVSMVSCMV